MSKIISKADTVDTVSKETGLSKTDTAKAIDSFVKAIKDGLQKRHSVRILGFGTFSVSKRKERKGRNPQTGEELHIPACWRPKFKAGKKFTESFD